MAAYPGYVDTTHENGVDPDVERMQSMLHTELEMLGKMHQHSPAAESETSGCQLDTSFMFGESTPWARDRFNAMIKGVQSFPSTTNPHNVAILLFGSERLSPETATSFERYVYKVLDRPDIFAYLSPEPNVPEKWLPHRKLWHDMATEYTVGPDYNYTGIFGHSPCLDWKYPDGSIWNGGWPKSSRPDIANMHQYHGMFKAGEMMRFKEKNRGRAYDWVIFTRVDHVHHAPHPIPGFLNREFVYLPSGSDWNGYIDRHGMFPRKAADHRINLHETLLDGTYHCPFPPGSENINMERIFRDLFAHHNISTDHIARYPATSVLGCTQPTCPPERNTSKYVDEGLRRNRNLNDTRIARKWEIIERQSALWNVYRRDCAVPALVPLSRPPSPDKSNIHDQMIDKLSRQLMFSASLMVIAVVFMFVLPYIARRWQTRAILARRAQRRRNILAQNKRTVAPPQI
jgi:hypothetical protein